MSPGCAGHPVQGIGQEGERPDSYIRCTIPVVGCAVKCVRKFPIRHPASPGPPRGLAEEPPGVARAVLAPRSSLAGGFPDAAVWSESGGEAKKTPRSSQAYRKSLPWAPEPGKRGGLPTMGHGPGRRRVVGVLALPAPLPPSGMACASRLPVPPHTSRSARHRLYLVVVHQRRILMSQPGVGAPRAIGQSDPPGIGQSDPPHEPAGVSVFSLLPALYAASLACPHTQVFCKLDSD